MSKDGNKYSRLMLLLQLFTTMFLVFYSYNHSDVLALILMRAWGNLIGFWIKSIINEYKYKWAKIAYKNCITRIDALPISCIFSSSLVILHET